MIGRDRWKLCEMLVLVEDLACSVGYACNELKMLDFVDVSGDLAC